MSASRRFHLCLPPDLEAELQSYRRALGLGMGPTIRLLVRRALEPEAEKAAARPPDDSLAALAALTAAEHAVLMVASVLPEGERRMRSLGERAIQAAEERLALFRERPVGSDKESR